MQRPYNRRIIRRPIIRGFHPNPDPFPRSFVRINRLYPNTRIGWDMIFHGNHAFMTGLFAMKMNLITSQIISGTIQQIGEIENIYKK